MTTRSTDDAFLSLAFSFESSPGAYALLLGAGVSASSGVLSAWGVLDDLCCRVAAKLGEEVPAGTIPVDERGVRWYETKFGTEPKYGELLEQVASTPTQRQELLAGYFEATVSDIQDGLKQPTQAHRAIARMVKAGVLRVIITLNFDRLIEAALRELGIEPLVVSTPAELDDMPALHTVQCVVIHLHGEFRNPLSMRNTATELSDYDQRTTDRLDRILEDYGLVIAGWSAIHDVALRQQIRSKYRGRHALVWIEPRRQDDVARELLTAKDGLLMSTTADAAFNRLADDIDAVRERRPAPPLTIPVAVAAAKRELSGGRVAVRLHDRLNQAFSDLHAHSDFHISDFGDATQYGGYPTMAARTAESANLPAALIAALAYWGDDATDEWWLPEVRRFAMARRGSGEIRLLQIQRIAAIRLFYAAGVAALAAGRFSTLNKLLRLSVEVMAGGGEDRLAALLGPETVLAEVPGGVRDFYAGLGPLLIESLSVVAPALEEAWEKFEIIRLATEVMRRPTFDDKLLALYGKQSTLEKMERARDAQADEQVQKGLNEAWQSAGRAMGSLADIVTETRAHVLTRRHLRDEGVGAPTARRLADDLSTLGAKHPLVTQGIFYDENVGAASVEAVSIQLGRKGDQLCWARHMNDGTGGVLDEIWLDTGLTPHERQA